MTDVNSRPHQDHSIRQVRQAAAERFRRAVDWVSFYREILGINGVIEKMFPDAHKRDEFEQTAEYAEIQHMLAKLRDRSAQTRQPDEPTRVITVRLPRSLHESLRHEAHHHKTSMNKLCISKLLQVIADELVPSDFERRESTPADSESSAGSAADPPPPAPNGSQPELQDDTTNRMSIPLPSCPTLNDALSSGRPF